MARGGDMHSAAEAARQRSGGPVAPGASAPASAVRAGAGSCVLAWAGRADGIALLAGVASALLVWFVLSRVRGRSARSAGRTVAIRGIAAAIALAAVFAVVRQLVPSGGSGDLRGPDGSGLRLVPALKLATVNRTTRHVHGELTPQRSVWTAGHYFNVASPRYELALLGVAGEGEADASVTCTIYVEPEQEEQRSLAVVQLPLRGSEWHVSSFDMADYEGKKCRVSVACAAPDAVPYHILISATTYQGRTEEARNVLVISLDGTRADHLGCYGYERPTSPAIDAVAAQGVRFECCNAQASWSYPSLVSMMTAEFPSVMWADQPIGEARRWHVENALTLAAVLKLGAFYTGAVTEGGQTAPESGLHQGFDTYRVTPPQSLEETFNDAVAWLKEHASDRFFLFVQTYEACPPYRAGPFIAPGAGATEAAIAAYDSSIAHADMLVGGLMEALDALGLRDRTLVVITSAHGQEFDAAGGEVGSAWEGMGHFGHTLRQSVLRVPLIMRAPGLIPAGKVIESPVACADLMPTVLGLLGFALPEALRECAGADLSPLILLEDVQPPQRAIFSEATGWGPGQKALLVGRRKLVYTPVPWSRMSARERRARNPWRLKPDALGRLFTGEKVRLYDIESDPEEKHNLAARDPATTAQLMTAMQDLLRRNANLRQKNEALVVGRAGARKR